MNEYFKIQIVPGIMIPECNINPVPVAGSSSFSLALKSYQGFIKGIYWKLRNSELKLKK